MKFSNWIVLLSSFLVLVGGAACKKDRKLTLPIEQEKLVQVLCDIHVAEAALQALSEQQKDSVAAVYYEQIYTLYGINAEQFKQTIRTLEKQPAALQQLYQIVMDTLARRETELN